MALESFAQGKVETSLSMADSVTILAAANERCRPVFGGSGNNSAQLGYRLPPAVGHTLGLDSAIWFAAVPFQQGACR
jgi:hypothetical protein